MRFPRLLVRLFAVLSAACLVLVFVPVDSARAANTLCIKASGTYTIPGDGSASYLLDGPVSGFIADVVWLYQPNQVDIYQTGSGNVYLSGSTEYGQIALVRNVSGSSGTGNVWTTYTC